MRSSANYNMVTGMFFWISDNEVPIDVRRPTSLGGRFSVTGYNVKTSKYILMGLLPLLLFASCPVIWLCRRGR